MYIAWHDCCKINETIGWGSMKKIKQLISLLLCLVICIGVPSTAYAKNFKVSTLESATFYHAQSIVPPVDQENIILPYYFKSSYPQYKYEVYQFYSDYISLEDGDIVTISVVLNHGKSCRYLSWRDSFIDIFSNNYGDPIVIGGEDCTYDSNTGTFKATFSVERGGNDLYLFFQAFEPVLTSYDPSVTFAFGVTDIIIDVKSEQSGFFDKVSDFFGKLFDDLTNWFNNLFEWLRDIRDNAVQLGNNLKSWFSDLSNNIKGFFTDLTNNIKEQFTKMINNLKTFFADVGQWFDEIGDRIGNFFTNLWNNITITINGITDGVREWWQGIVDWFNSLFKISDGYFDEYGSKWDEWFAEHFGIAYQAITLVDEIITRINDGLSKGSMSVVTFPPISFTIGDRPIFLNLPKKLDLNQFYNQDSMLANLLTMFRIMSSAIILICLVNYAHKFINNNVLQSEGDG